MLKNYFLTACRTFWRNKAFSLINILGLSIGISAALVIFLIASYEFSYDRFEKGRDRIYRVVLDASFSGNPVHSAAVPAPLGGMFSITPLTDGSRDHRHLPCGIPSPWF